MNFVYQLIPDWSDKEKLEKEKEVIGFYLSAHPLKHIKNYYPGLQFLRFESILKKWQFDESVARSYCSWCRTY